MPSFGHINTVLRPKHPGFSFLFAARYIYSMFINSGANSLSRINFGAYLSYKINQLQKVKVAPELVNIL